jgi:hypothetical protein
MASSTDVRAWAREQGHDVPARGSLPQHLKDLYDQAHPASVIQGEILDSAMGVTEADFPPDEPDYPEPPAHKTPARERKPRAVKAPPPRGGFRERIFGSKTTARPKHAKGPRISLSDWAEETWTDLAFLAQPIPPLARILDIQAPYAGVVFDDQVKHTIADTLLQPVAQYSQMFRGLNGLAGPPVYVGLICATGARVQLTDQNGKGLIDQDGQPVTDFDQRTKMLFQGLRYSLLQMTKITEVNAGAIMTRRIESEERKQAVEIIIATIFDMPMPTFSPPPSAPTPDGGGDFPSPNGYRYPDAPGMDMTGADPGRM